VNDPEYSREFFDDNVDKARSSAAAIVPLVMELVAPASVVDLGCGPGAWLATFARHGVGDYLGVDGEWVAGDVLEIPPDRFLAARLDKPLELDRKFDLAVSLEVAEHLPERAAKGFVETLSRLAPCVLFSAAIPHQGGLHHVNEQWPGYWASLFERHGYLAIDAIRPRVWESAGVAFWYKQNTLLYAREDVIAAQPALARARASTVESMLSLVHPRLLTYVAEHPAEHVRRPTAREHSLRDLAHALPHVVARSLSWRLGRLRRRKLSDGQ
jgi:SAM-dependent methyltransferase